MRQSRDVYQRKIYALTRMNQAITRMNRATDELAQAKALRWVNVWLIASGLRQFKIGPRSRKRTTRGTQDGL